MARPTSFRRTHGVSVRESWDKVVLGLAFVIGVGGGIALKIFEYHPFVAAGFSAAVLAAYAVLAYTSTSLRLEPEVIGDNTYYLGFLFTLTSLSVTLYFVVQAGDQDRAKLIPEVISGFGVALVSTIVGVFIRVLMMQFRLDVVSRERETRVEIDDAARRLRGELTQALQQIKLFSVESLQRAAERESEFKRMNDMLVSATNKSFANLAQSLTQETTRVFRDQTAAAIQEIRQSVSNASRVALDQMSMSFNEIGQSSAGLLASHDSARRAADQTNAELHQQTNSMVDSIGQLARRLRAVSDEIESSGVGLSQSIAKVSARLDLTLAETSRRLDDGVVALLASTKSVEERAAQIIGELEVRLGETMLAVKLPTEKPSEPLVLSNSLPEETTSTN